MSIVLLLSAEIQPTASQAESLRVRATVDFGEDVGQNFGSLFEIHDAAGNARIGAGFLGAYNTQPRSSRRTLHFYVKSTEEAFRLEKTTLPKPTTDAGVYLYDFRQRLFARSRNGTDRLLRFWNDERQIWEVDEDTSPYATRVADGILAVTGSQVTWNGRPIYTLADPNRRLGEYYYANGFLFLRIHNRNSDPWQNQIFAIPWLSSSPSQLDPTEGIALELRTPNEFAYAFGQLGSKVIVSTNTGGNYDFDGKTWRTLLEPDTSTSFQIYSILNYHNVLLMGQYPTGKLFEYNGQEMRLRENWPPVLPGVQDRAREAQTMAIYRGDLYCGVWPWGEVWRLNPNRDDWSFAGRMFEHPKLNDQFRHPYEQEMSRFDSVLNRWGQRVTSLVPFGDSLYVGTSAKTSAPFESQFTFLNDGRWRDYGQVHRLTAPGQLSVHTRWTSGPTTFEFVVEDNQMFVLQDGNELGRGIAPKQTSMLNDVSWGKGVFGRLRGKLTSRNWNR